MLESATGVASGATLATDPRFAPYLFDWEIENLNAHFTNRGGLTMDDPFGTIDSLNAY